MIVFLTARTINLPNVPSLLPSSELEGVQGEACISLWRKGVKWQRRKIKPWFAAREAESTAPKVSPEELTLLSRDLCSSASSRDSWHAAFCWCSSHKRRAEVLVEHLRLFACIWWWKRGGSGRTRQCQGRMREREDWGEGSCWSSSAEHPGPVWRYKKSNGRNGRSARAWGEGMNQETAGGILGLMTGVGKQG